MYKKTKLLANKRNLETRHQRSSLVLRPDACRVGDEMDVHALEFRVCVDVDFYLWEEHHGVGWKTERHDARDRGGCLDGSACGW